MPTPAVNPARREPVSILMVAIGGYGYYYLRTLLDEVPHDRGVLAGVVDPFARQSRAWPEVESLRVPVCNTVEEYYATGGRADLAVIVSPLHMHAPQSAAALAHGTAVLCDKPLAVTVQDARALIRARDQAGRPVAIGYQWSFSTAIQSLKRELLAGSFGRPRRLVTLCCWPRTPAYYGRNRWAGRLRDADSGALVLDSPANNAMAHFLHNACFLLGPTQALSAMPVEVSAELYRANAIDSADTAACRAAMDNGCEVVFLASHATDSPVAPRFRLECDDAVIVYGEHDQVVTATSSSGTTRQYGDPDATPQFHKLDVAIAMARGRAEPHCGIEAAMAQTVCVNAMHDSVPEIVPFASHLLRTLGDGGVAVQGLGDALLACYARGELPHEATLPWTHRGGTIATTHYAHFPGGQSPATPAAERGSA